MANPVMVKVTARENLYLLNLPVEVQGPPARAYRAVKETFERVTQSDFNGQFIDRQVAESFAGQQRTSTIMTLFTAMAILISLPGLFAMSTYFIRQRAKEIAVRKVFGSTGPEVFGRLIRTFLSYAVIAFVIATPAVRYVMNRWLSSYSCRISLSPRIFIAAGLFCLLISLVTVFFQSYVAANANPVKNIKSE
ncbi:MAG: FtsX-like permease family protein [Tannerella sp.]|jgi:putative ABC transport system permease protein|nr:FtsX-like permease family protein [Tannerella sp.]